MKHQCGDRLEFDLCGCGEGYGFALATLVMIYRHADNPGVRKCAGHALRFAYGSIEKALAACDDADQGDPDKTH